MDSRALSIEERTADEILSQHWDRSLPVNVEVIAKRLGANIVPHLGTESGCLEVDGNYVSIKVKSDEPIARRRFTIAHELGHWKMDHGNRFRDPASNYSSGALSFVERQANKFAACLLMPRSTVKHLAITQGKNVDDLARAFSVSRSAMEFRLRNLGLIS